MIKIKYNIRLLSMICLVMSIGLLITSCKKDKEVNSGVVELLSFGPSGLQHGEKIIFIGKNLDKVNYVTFVGDSIPFSSFVELTPEMLVIVVPEKAERGFVTLKTMEGNIVSKTQLDFMVPVTISAITENVRPGDNITITGTYMNWVTKVWFTKDISVTEFVSKSLNELVVKVPMNAKTGRLIINSGGMKPMSIETEKDLKVVLPSISGISPIPIERGGNLAITGSNLDLTKEVLLKGVTAPITDFVSKSATQLVITVPQATTKGKITLVAYSLVAVESEQKLLIVGDLPDLDPLDYTIYKDALENGWQNWGWGNTADLANTENVRDGNASIKATFSGGWGAISLGNVTIPTDNYSQITFSIFGSLGTNGKQIKVMANSGTPYIVTIEEGKWVEYKLTKADLGNPNPLTGLVFQEMKFSGIIYFDYIGLRK